MGSLSQAQSAWKQFDANVNGMGGDDFPRRDFKDLYLGSPKVLAEKLLHNQAISGTLTIPVRDYNQQGNFGYTATIPFFLSGDMTFTMGNEWKDALSLDKLEGLGSFINGFHTVTGDTAQISMQSEAMSSQVWKGSTFSGFNIDCLFVATNRGFNTLRIMNILSAACLPTKYAQQPEAAGKAFETVHDVANKVVDMTTGAVGWVADKITENSDWNMDGAKQAVNDFGEKAKGYINDMGMIAPLNYGLNPTTEGGLAENPMPHSTLTLQIGDYFRADNLIVEGLNNVTMSKEVIAPPTTSFLGETNVMYSHKPDGNLMSWGFPLYVKCNIKLRPHSMMHFTKWQSYFLRSADRHDYPEATMKKVTTGTSEELST